MKKNKESLDIQTEGVLHTSFYKWIQNIDFSYNSDRWMYSFK